ncbi:ribonuclease H-like domain-containing protein [Tanacetum coccineum]
MRPFGCHVTILNTLYYLGDGPRWLFDINVLTKSMNYEPVVACTNSNDFVGTKESIGADGSLFDSSSKNASNDKPQPSNDVGKKDDEGVSKERGIDDQERPKNSTQDVNNCRIKLYTTAIKKGKRDIGTKGIFRNKKDKRGIMIRNKARLVAHGHTQDEGINYDEVFAPVAIIEAIRLFLAYASFMGFMVYQMDVKSAFLYENIEEEQKEDGIFISQDKYVVEILRKFGFTDVKSASTLVDIDKPLLNDLDDDNVDVHLYRSMIGSLMYLTSLDHPINVLQLLVDKQIGMKLEFILLRKRQTATGKEFSNPLMAGSLPKTISTKVSTAKYYQAKLSTVRLPLVLFKE